MSVVPTICREISTLSRPVSRHVSPGSSRRSATSLAISPLVAVVALSPLVAVVALSLAAAVVALSLAAAVVALIRAVVVLMAPVLLTVAAVAVVDRVVVALAAVAAAVQRRQPVLPLFAPARQVALPLLVLLVLGAVAVAVARRVPRPVVCRVVAAAPVRKCPARRSAVTAAYRSVQLASTLSAHGVRHSRRASMVSHVVAPVQANASRCSASLRAVVMVVAAMILIVDSPLAKAPKPKWPVATVRTTMAMA